MMYSGKALKVEMLPSGAANLVFDLEGSSVNKFNQTTLKELREVVTALQDSSVSGLIVSSVYSWCRHYGVHRNVF